ncbi:MAG: GMC family oxidoreductase N-terminal domain-containing protein [Candidatus Andersenbacteria bacterium]
MNTNNAEVVVIGSGPAGVACASALLEQGVHVHMLDVGETLEPEQAALVQQLRSQPKKSWPSHIVRKLKTTSASKSGLPMKRVWGSDFPYKKSSQYIPTKAAGVDAGASVGQGGFSTVWGAAVLPYSAEDMLGWPISPLDLAPHYKAVLAMMPIAAQEDTLALKHPLYGIPARSIQRGEQVQRLVRNMKSHTRDLAARGVTYGFSRLAINVDQCGYCGMCMYGCIHDAMYSSAHTLVTLQTHPRFRYTPGIIVQKVAEEGDKVQIMGKETAGDKQYTATASQVYIAAGVFSTTKILLESLGAYNEPISIQDSQYFMAPLLQYQATPHVTKEVKNTLSQVFIRLQDTRISSYPIHLQVYSFSDIFLEIFRLIPGLPDLLWRLPLNSIFGRWLSVGGYLHSNDSDKITAQLVRGTDREDSYLKLEAVPQQKTRVVLNSVMQKLTELSPLWRARIITSVARKGHPGRGFHSGGSFPMKTTPGRFESDLMGRPYGFSRVHAVDSTVFPTVPANTITLTIMANARRIAYESQHK